MALTAFGTTFDLYFKYERYTLLNAKWSEGSNGGGYRITRVFEYASITFTVYELVTTACTVSQDVPEVPVHVRPSQKATNLVEKHVSGLNDRRLGLCTIGYLSIFGIILSDIISQKFRRKLSHRFFYPLRYDKIAIKTIRYRILWYHAQSYRRWLIITSLEKIGESH